MGDRRRPGAGGRACPRHRRARRRDDGRQHELGCTMAIDRRAGACPVRADAVGCRHDRVPTAAGDAGRCRAIRSAPVEVGSGHGAEADGVNCAAPTARHRAQQTANGKNAGNDETASTSSWEQLLNRLDRSIRTRCERSRVAGQGRRTATKRRTRRRGGWVCEQVPGVFPNERRDRHHEGRRPASDPRFSTATGPRLLQASAPSAAGWRVVA